MTKRFAGFAAAVLVMSAQAAVWAGPIPWSKPSGTTSRFSYSDGQEDKGLYGDPTVDGNTFEFLTPHDFEAEAENGSAQTTSDRASVKVNALTNSSLTGINIVERGDYSILGGVAQVKDSGLLLTTRLDSGHFGVQYSLTPTVTYTDADTHVTTTSNPKGDGDGTWKAVYFLTLPSGTDSIQLVLNNILQATSTSGTTSFIQKKSVEITVTTPTPEPATLGLAAIAGVGLLRRRRVAVAA